MELEATTIGLGLILSVVLGVVIPLYRWASRATQSLGKIEMLAAELISMHQNPEKHNFGTGKTNAMIETVAREQTQLLKQMVHYLEWYVETSTGKKSPPFVDT